MSRQQIIERICSLINADNSNEIKNSAQSLLADFSSNRVSLNEAVDRLNDLENSKSRYWESIDLPKSLFDNIKKFKKGELSDIQRIKLVSSVITRCAIEIEYHPDINPDTTGIYDFMKYLNFLLLGVDEYNEYDMSESHLFDLLMQYGFINKSKEVS